MYHYVMTLQVPLGGANYALVEASGGYTPAAGETRTQAFEHLKANALRGNGFSADLRTNTLFFCLEPDSLMEGAGRGNA